VVHGLRGRASNRKIATQTQKRALQLLQQPDWHDFGPTFASEQLAKRHGIEVSDETLRKWMIEAGLWRPGARRMEEVHCWRPRRSAFGELVQWDTSEHDWLEGRGQKMYLIHMIDDATSELTARFVPHDSTEENMRLLKTYLERHGRPVAFYTDKASLFQTTPRIARDRKELPRDEREPLPPTQIGRALRELGIAWIAAHSPQAKGRVERSFQTAQDRLVKGLRVAGAKTLEEANRYLEQEFVPWWNQHLKRLPQNPTDAHRPVGPEHDLAAALSLVETRQVTTDYTIRFQTAVYQIAREDIRAGLRGANVRVEVHLDGSLKIRFQERYLRVNRCQQQPKAIVAVATHRKSPARPRPSTAWQQQRDKLFAPSNMPLWKAAQIDRTRTSDSLEE
jgi:transposase-like protein